MDDRDNVEFEGLERRSEPRTPVEEYTSVEFSVSDLAYNYQFKILETSASGMRILVKEDSAVMQYLKVGDILNMKYYPVNPREGPENLRTEIKHITRDDEGRFRGHYLIGLAILEK